MTFSSGENVKRSSPQSFASGFIAGAVGQLIGHPLDTVKVHAQTGSKLKHVTISSLFRGCTGPILSAGGIQSINLGLYENFRRILTNEQSGFTPLYVVAASGSAAGICISVLTSPVQRVKVFQQLHGGLFIPTVLHLAREGSLYRGFTIQAFLDSGRGLYMCIYVFLKRKFAISLGMSEKDEVNIPLWARISSGSLAATVCWGLIYPFDSIKSIQMSTASTTSQSGPACIWGSLVAQGGIARLYRGFGYTILRAGPVSGVTLPLFDIALRALEVPNWNDKSK